ncbi:hypothetical protein [Owenweeksia hongkongensis]|uniref:hypothetical protein n=1 Tax=Owenweeksia hongkongensis TaxID=253245 RepID=UPI003A905D7B
MMKKALLSTLFILLGLSLNAQKFKKFTPEKETYLNELRDYLKETDVNKKDVLEPFLLEVSAVWNSGGISDREAQEIYKISNHFLKKRVSSYQAWSDFFKVIIHLESNEEEDMLLPWLEDLESTSAKNPARFTEDYLRTMYLTFYEYTFFDDGRVKWRAEAGDYEYGFEGEPVFKFEAADIWGYYKNDSTFIEATEGLFYPKRYEFVGQGGNVYFTRVKLTQDTAYAELRNYKLNVRKTDFEADSVKLTTLIFLKEPTMGKFEEKLTSQSGGGGTFPRFTSYRSDITIPDIVPGADYEGGFSMIGSKFYGGGTGGNRAKLSFKYEGKKVVSAEADRFLLRLDKIESEEVRVTIYIEEDSIFHPKVTARYLPERKQLSIIRGKEGLGQTPFSDSYHNLDMTFEVLSWKMDEPMMSISNMNLGSESPVIFESSQYFRGQRFSALTGLDTKNPLFRLQEMSSAYGKRDFTVEEVAYFMRMDESNAHIFMMNMSIRGFVKYDLQKREAYFNDKIYEYIQDFKKERDYDVIRFVSNMSQGSNAQLSLLSHEMEINGVQAVALSDSQKVGLFPVDQKIVVHKDLNFDFDGRITAGRFTYWGDLFKFNYDQFRINMENIDSMRFKVESFDVNALGQRELKTVKTVLQGLTGELLIDDPRNKSGQKEYTEYPIFKSAKDSYVYYDKKDIFDRVYNREEFYVRLDPFEIDSLDNITTQGLQFAGTFTSAGIFPDMDQVLKVQPDYSLGFTTETPPGGLAAYGGKGTFSNTLNLSNKGLRGDGQIDYLNSVATSDEFFFFPDSTDGIANNYEITAQVTGPETPHAVGLGVKLHWEPKNDVLYTTSQATPFAMYDDVGMITTGTLAHSPTALRGDAKLEFLNAETKSKDFLFKHRKFSSDKMAFKVRANPEKEWGFGMDDANGIVDFDKEKGDFYLNNPADYFSFPANKYICYMDYAKWEIPAKAINVKKTGSQASSKMISVHPRQDSLQFVAGNTRFFLENSLLESFKVPNIDVADASIFPDTGYVAIEENAHMRTLNNAAIQANRTTKYHDFYGGIIDITSRKKYIGQADYEYIDQDGTPWPIRFNEIKADTSQTTVGRAVVTREEGFYMSPYFAYFGKVGLRADRKALAFEGSTHIESNCAAVETDWFDFKSIVDPSNIVIDLPEVDPDDKTKTLASGIYLAHDTIGGYAAFLSKKVSPADKQMFFANGKLYFDEAISSYVITTAERLENTDAKGNYLAFNSTNCTMYGEGVMSLGDGKSQLKINSWGTIDYNLENDVMEMDLVLGLDFFFSHDILKLMATTINKETLLEGVDLSRPAFKAAVNTELKEKEKRKFNSDISSFGAPSKMPEELENTLFFAELHMKWTPEAVSFLSDGKIGIGTLGEYGVNKKLEGYVEIQRKRRGDEVYLYLAPDRSTDYYFEYKRNMMSVYSNDDAVMDVIKNLDLDKRRNEEKGKPPFTYTIGTKGKMSRFLNRFEKFE